MKTFTQFSEDLKAQSQRSADIRQATLDRHNRRVANYRDKLQAQKDKEEEHQEIVKKVKRELQTEQIPHVTPTPFNIMKAREQVKGGIKHRTHVHQEIGAEARRQEAAHQKRLSKLTGTP